LKRSRGADPQHSAAGRFRRGPYRFDAATSTSKSCGRRRRWTLTAGAGTIMTFLPSLSVNQPASQAIVTSPHSAPAPLSHHRLRRRPRSWRAAWIRRPCITVSCPYPAGTRYTDAGWWSHGDADDDDGELEMDPADDGGNGSIISIGTPWHDD